MNQNNKHSQTKTTKNGVKKNKEAASHGGHKTKGKRVKSVYKEAHSYKDMVGFSNWEVPEDMEAKVLAFEKEHGRFSTLEDLAMLFNKYNGKSPHSSTSFKDILEESKNSVSNIGHNMIGEIFGLNESVNDDNIPKELEVTTRKEDDNETDDSVLISLQKFLATFNDISPSYRQYVSIVEDMLMIVYALYRETKIDVVVWMICSIFKNRVGDSLSCVILDYVKGIFCDPEFFGSGKNVKTPQAKSVKNILRDFKTFRSSQFLKKLHSLLSISILCGFVNPIHIDLKGIEVYSNKGLEIVSNASDFFTYVTDTMEYFFTTGYEFFMKDFSALWTIDEIAQLDRDIIWLNTNLPLVGLGEFTIRTGVTVTEFQRRLFETYETARFLSNNISDKTTRSLMLVKLEKLAKMIVQYEQEVPIEGMRAAPFSFCVSGASSVGKSAVVNILMLSVLKFNGQPCKDSNICTLQPNDKFYSTFRADSTAVLLDDVANVKTDKAQSNPCDMLISLVNNVMYYAPKADVKEKGKIKVQPKVVAVTTNVKDLRVSDWSNEPISVLRRLRYHIVVKVKPEFCKHGNKLDPTKITKEQHDECDSTGIMDLWDISVEEVVSHGYSIVGGPEDYRFSKVIYKGEPAENLSIYDVIALFNLESRNFYAQQDKLITGQKNIGSRMSFDEVTGLPVRGPQSYAYTKVIDSAGTIVYNAVQDQLWRKTECFRPNLLEYFILNKSHKYAMKKLADKFCADYLTPMHYVPYSVRQNNYFRLFYQLVNRKYIVGSMLLFGTIGAAMGFTKAKQYGNSNITSIFIGGLLSFTSLTAAKHTAYRHIMNEMENAPLHSIMKEERVIQASEVLLKAGITITAGLIFVDVLKKVYKLYRVTAQSSLDPKNADEIRDRDLSVNVWKNNTMAYIPSNAKTATMTAAQLSNALEANCFHILFEDAKTENSIAAIAIKSNVFGCALHFFYKKLDINGTMLDGTYKSDGSLKPRRLEVKIKRTYGENATYFRATIFMDTIERVGDHDFCIFQLQPGGSLPNIIHLFPEGNYSGLVQVVYRRASGVIARGHGSCVSKNTGYMRGGRMIKIRGGDATYSFPTEEGMCSAFLVSQSNNPEIVGLHIAGITGTQFASYISPMRQEIERACALLSQHTGTLMPHSASDFVSKRYNIDMGYTPTINEKSPVNYIEERDFLVRGSIGTGSTYHSTVKDTYVSKTVEEVFDIINPYGPPRFSPQRWKPWYTYLDTASESSPSIDPSYLLMAKNDYLKPLLSRLGAYATPESMGCLSLSEVINGIPGVRFIDAINFNTSIGYPLVGKKKKHLLGEEGSFYLDPKLGAEDEMNRMISKYIKGERAYPIFKACLKDEPTKKDKDKVRVFHASDLGLSLLWRKYGLKILRFLSIYPLVSECGVGINPFSDEWQELHDYVTHKGEANDRIIAGDYSKWDIRLPTELVSIAFQVIIDIAIASRQYTPDDVMVLRGLCTDTLYYVCHFNGTLLEMAGGVPSGHNLTAHINSIANSILIRTGFYATGNKGPFRNSIHVMTYGDDFFGGATLNCTKFDHVVYKEWLSEHGIILTMPDKVMKPQPYLSIEDCDFLKRRSVKCEYNGKHYGALDQQSLIKSLLSHTKIKISKEQHIHSVMQMAIREMSYHRREEYEAFREKLRKICENHQLCTHFLRFNHREFYDNRNTDELEIVEDITSVMEEDNKLIDNDYHDEHGALYIRCHNKWEEECSSSLTSEGSESKSL